MKYRILDILKCPECRGAPLSVNAFEVHHDPIQEEIPIPRCAFFCSFEKEHGSKACTAYYQQKIK